MIRSLSLAAGLSLVLAAGSPADDPMPITSDTPGYCLTLARRMESEAVMDLKVHLLWEQGRDLCLHGHVRGGLLRLRRAMMITHGAAE